MADKIQVAVRVRPVLFQKKDVEVHWGSEKGMIYQVDPATKKRLGNPYLFDQVFEPHTQNHQIFSSVVQPLIDSAMDGFNVTVLAYGQTASGKTYTMMGSQKECGIVQLAVERIFNTIEQNPERAFLLRCSYIEIYNETISDLLSTTHQKLKLQELAEGNVIVHNLIETSVNSPDAVIKLMQQGNKHRKVGGTSMNERSSRSHTIFRIIVESVPRAEADRSDAAVMVSHINLVDLAGSEKASQTHATGDRFREGCAINTSLSALSLVIKQLSDGEGFVNFRDSKLTHILRASLGGNARTAIICNVTPTVLDETSSTLKFASSAKTVQNQPHVNEVLSEQALLRKYNNHIKDLEKKLKEKEQEQRPEAFEEMERLLQEKEMKIQELKEKLVISSITQAIGVNGDNQMTSSQRSLRRMTWGGNRLKQMLNFPPVPVFESNAPVFASVGINRVRRTSFKSRKSDPSFDEVSVESETSDAETFLPAEMVFAKPTEPITKVDAATMTELPQASPFRKPFESPFKRPHTPGTPAPVLRERMLQLRKTLEEREQENNDLREELEDLSNFTRLEQQIGVHAQVIAKTCSTQDSAEQLHKALQTANDMEVLYLDTQRKLSELQTHFREKEVEHETEVRTVTTDFQVRLDEETNERKRLAKELNMLREKYERLERDQAEADTHLQVVIERHSKREADLRQSLQEAWAQLEKDGQDPRVLQEGFAAKEQAEKMGKEIEDMQAKYQDAQTQILALTEELQRAKESANRTAFASTKYDHLDSSFSGMCLADELRDVFTEQDSSFAPSSIRPRKRPSSILSVALAKMEQSTCIFEGDQDVEPSKKTRFSVSNIQTEDLDIKEVKEIREYLVELQAVLVRYEEDYELLSREKEAVNSQLVATQKEVATLREVLSFKRPGRQSSAKEDISTQKVDACSEDFETSCIMEENSIILRQPDMELTVDDMAITPEKIGVPQLPLAAFSSIDQELLAEELEQLRKSNEKLESNLMSVTEKLQSLQGEINAKTIALEESQRALEAAVSASKALEMVNEQKDEVINSLRQVNDDIQVLREESVSLLAELETARQFLAEMQLKFSEISEEKELCANKLFAANEELESVRSDLNQALEQLQINQEHQGSTNSLALEMDLAKALDRISELEAEIESKATDIQTIQAAGASDITTSAGDLDIALNKIKELEKKLEVKTAEIDAVQSALESTQSLLVELQAKPVDSSNDILTKTLDRVRELEAEIESKSPEIEAIKVSNAREANGSSEDLDIALTNIQELEKEIELKTTEFLTIQSALESAQSRIVELEAELNGSSIDELAAARTQIEQLELEVDSKTSEVQAIQTALEQACARADERESKFSSCTSEELTIASNRIKSLEAELELKSAEMEAVVSALEEASVRMAAIENQSTQEDLQLAIQRFEALKRDVDEKERELNAASTKLNEALSLIEKIKEDNLEEMLAIRAELEKANGCIKTLESQLEIKSAEVNAATAALEEASSKMQDCNEREKLEELVERLTCQLEELEQIVEEKDQLLDDARDAAYQSSLQHKEIMEAEKEQNQKEVNRLLEQINELRIQLDATSAELLSAKQELADSLTQAREVLLVKENLEVQLKSAKEKLNELEEQIEEKKAQLETNSFTIAEADTVHIAKLETQLEEARKKIEELEVKNDFLQADLTSAEVRSSELEAILEEKTAALSKAEYANAKFQEAREQLEAKVDQVRELKSKLEEADIQIANLCSDREEARAQLLEAGERIQSLEEDVESERDAHLASQQAAKEASKLAEAKLLESETEKNKFSQDLNGAMQEIEALRQVAETATSELRSARAQISALEETNRVNCVPRENLTALEQEWKEAVLRVSHLESSIEEETRKYSLACQDLASAQSQIKLLEQSVKEYMIQIDTLQNKLQDSSNKNVAQTEEVAKLESALHVKNEEISNLRISNAKISLLEDKIEELNRNTANLSRAVEEKCQTIATLEVELSHVNSAEVSRNEQIRHLENRIKERQTELEDTRAALVAMQTANEQMSANLSDKENQNMNLQSSLENTNQRFEIIHSKLELMQAEKSRLVQQIQQLETDIHCRDQELEALRGEMENLHQEREMCQHLKQRLNNVLAEKAAAIQHCEKLRDARDELIRQHDRLTNELQEIASKLHTSESAKNNMEQTLAQYESQKEVFFKDYQRLKEALANTEDRMKYEIEELKRQVHAANIANETLEQKIFQYETQKESFMQEYQRMKAALTNTEERLGCEVKELAAQLQVSSAAKAAMEQNMAQFEAQKEAFLQDYKRLKKSLADTEEQLQIVQAQRDDYFIQMKTLGEQMADARARIAAVESTAKYQTQRHLEETIEALKRELVETRSNSEIVRLNHETEEENRKKKIDRLEKEYESLKQQYIKCKEQLRLSRSRESEDGTVSLPKTRSSSKSTFVQTDPIADKGFGFRWQADQYTADNERLRKKASEIGERMEFYKEKLIKYRTLYFQATGQDPNQRPPSGNGNPVQPIERRSSTSSNHRENIAADFPVVEGEKPVKEKSLAPTSSLLGATLAEQQIREPVRGVQTRSATGSLPGTTGASRWTGIKKESLTKEEMEKINNCNPS